MSGRVGKCRNDDGKCREMSGNVGISSGGGPSSDLIHSNAEVF